MHAVVLAAINGSNPVSIWPCCRYMDKIKLLSLNHTEYFEKILHGSAQIPGQVMEWIMDISSSSDAQSEFKPRSVYKYSFFTPMPIVFSWARRLKYQFLDPKQVKCILRITSLKFTSLNQCWKTFRIKCTPVRLQVFGVVGMVRVAWVIGVAVMIGVVWGVRVVGVAGLNEWNLWI